MKGKRNVLKQLQEALGGRRGALILPHNDPDPDAIASAYALSRLLGEKLKVKSRIVYQGMIGRAENRALVHFLGNPFERLKASDFDGETSVALVDAQPGTGNVPLPPGIDSTIVIDHHPSRHEGAPAAFEDIRSDVGSTSTILTEYLRRARLEPDPVLATALFYGIRTDTMELGRGASPADADAYFYLYPRIDVEGLSNIVYAQLPVGYFRSFSAALESAKIYDDVVVSNLGAMAYPDLGSEMADILLRLQGVRWVLCMGVFEGELIIAVRARGARAGAGTMIQAVVGKLGSAGGHGSMAAGHIPLGRRNPEKLFRLLLKGALQYLKGKSDIPGKTLV
jgi:nanoRNase/pAp phosphatase (c-di-AMP/oligoRNAs hydrolase)